VQLLVLFCIYFQRILLNDDDDDDVCPFFSSALFVSWRAHIRIRFAVAGNRDFRVSRPTVYESCRLSVIF